MKLKLHLPLALLLFAQAASAADEKPVPLAANATTRMEIDLYWEIQVPRVWKQTAQIGELASTYTCTPAPEAVVGPPGIFLFNPRTEQSADPAKCRGLCFVFGPKECPVIIDESGEKETIELFGRKLEAYRFPDENGGKTEHIVILTSTKALPGYQYLASRPLLISFVFSSDQEFEELKRVASTIRKQD